MRTLLLFLAACPRSQPSPPAAGIAADTLTGPWQCKAFVARAATLEIVTVDGVGPDEAAADQDAWTRACAALPPSLPPERCEAEAPPSGWTWTRELQAPRSEGETALVRLVLTPEPVPFSGSGESSASQDQACERAYVAACAAALAPPGCQHAPGFQDDGVEAVEATRPAAPPVR